MKKRITNMLKYNKVIYSVYYYSMSLCMKLLKLFVKTDKNLILINSFAGRKYDDSTKAIFDCLKNDDRFEGYKIIWAFHEPEKFSVEGAEKIKTDTLNYFITAMKARVWITNSSIERGLNFTGRNTYYLNTWHGTPFKKLGADIDADNKSFSTKSGVIADAMNVQSEFEMDTFSRCFRMPKERFIKVGLPRNDELVNCSERQRKEYREKIGISEEKRVILYCPTFREYDRDEHNGIVLSPPVDFEKWRKRLGDDYMILVRAHYEVSTVMQMEESSFLKNVTDYDSLNELMIASDILISDYSSIIFDYSLMDKPMIHFTYDYEEYEKKRGLYIDIRNYISGGKTEDEILDIICDMDVNDEIEKTKAFRYKYMNYYGNATKLTVDWIAKNVIEKE